MHYDTVIIGAGMSGLAAGIRLAYFDQRVCILERHEVYGGLNSFYTLQGRQFDVGLHALTNYAPKGTKQGPLPKLLRQLRISHDEFDLREQNFSEIRFPGKKLRFDNGGALLVSDVAEQFPHQIDGFARLWADVEAYDDVAIDVTPRSSRKVLAEYISDPMLIDMLLCPLMFYGNAQEQDMDFTHFVTLFKSLYCQGFARPRDGVRAILKTLVRKYKGLGGKLRTRSGVQRLEISNGQVASLVLDSGETITANTIFSSAGYIETMRLCSDADQSPPTGEVGRLSFVESISCLDCTPAELGHQPAIVFFSDMDHFEYARPDGLIDPRSGVICCPNNYRDHEHLTEGMVRLTSLANYDRWSALDADAYKQAKRDCYKHIADTAIKYVPEFRQRVTFTDFFTPLTIERFTGHLNGAVYGAPSKRRDGCTRLKNLFICGTDQGFLGIVGALLSGISMANMHVLAKQ